MKITDVQAIHLRLDDVAETADGTQDVLLVEIFTDEGITGIGEVSSCSYVCRAIVEAPRSASKRHGLRSILLGRDPLDIKGNYRLMLQETSRYGRDGIVQSAIGAVDTALWDILGKTLSEPLHSLVGGKRRNHVRPYGSLIFGDTPEDTAARAAKARALGLSAVKFGWGPFGENEELDLAHVESARNALGDDALLMIDAGQSWDARTALDRAHKLGRYNVEWLEEPLRPDDLDGYRWLCQRSPIAIAGGELETGVVAFNRYLEQGLQIIQPDVTICGGLSVAIEASEMAYSAGRRTVAHSFSTGVSLLAALHWMASRPDGDLIEYCLSPSPLMHGLVSTAPAMIDGLLLVPDTPGLGIEIDSAIRERYEV